RSRAELLAEVCRRDLVRAQQRLALRRTFAPLVAFLELGDRYAEPLRELLHRIREAHLLLQLDELEDVPARAAPEAVEEAAIAMDGEGRRFLAVERTEALVARAGLAERDVVRDHGHDVGGAADLVDERLGKARHGRCRDHARQKAKGKRQK